MKNFLFLVFASVLIFSCSDDSLVDTNPSQLGEDSELSTRNRHAAPCTATFVGYDENGCCIYTLPYAIVKDLKKGGTYIMVNGRKIFGNTFTICETATVRVIRETDFQSILVCEVELECESSCDIDVNIQDVCVEGNDCCWSISVDGVDNHTISINGNSSSITGDICICAEYGENIEIIIYDENGAICFEDTLFCYLCPQCSEVTLEVTMSPVPPENGVPCCYIYLQRYLPDDFDCELGVQSFGLPEVPGVTVSGVAGTPVSTTFKVCGNNLPNTTMVGTYGFHGEDYDADNPDCSVDVEFTLTGCD